jgi:hypothetical protein
MKWQDIVLWILFILSLIMGFWYLFGNSPTFEQTLLVLIITFLFKIQYDVAINSFEAKNLRISFNALAKDFKEHLSNKSIHRIGGKNDTRKS